MIAVTIRTAKIVAFIQFIPRISLPSVPSARSSFRPPHDLETGPPQFGDDAQRELLDIAVRVLFDGCGDEAHKASNIECASLSICARREVMSTD